MAIGSSPRRLLPGSLAPTRPPSLYATALAAATAGLLLIVLAESLHWGGAAAVSRWADIGWTGSALFALAACLWRTVRLAGSDRLVWTFLTVGVASWFGGQVVWDYYDQFSQFPAAPTPADVGYLGFGVAFLAGLLIFARRGRWTAPWLGLDILVVGTSFTIIYVAVFSNDILHSPLSAAGQSTGLLYPVLFSTLAVIIVLLPVEGIWLVPSARLLMLGLVCEVIPFIGWTPANLRGTFAAGTPLDFIWMAGMLLIGLSAGRFRHFPPVAARVHAVGPGIYVVVGVASLAILTRLWLFSLGIATHQLESVTVAAVSALVLMLALRLVLTLGLTQRLLQRARQNEDRFSKLLHGSPTAILMTRTSDGLIAAGNRRFADLTGYSLAELVGRTARELHLYADPLEQSRLIALLRDGRSVQNRAVTIRAKDGRRRSMLVSMETVMLDGDQYIISNLLDVTEQRRTQDLVRQQAELLELAHDAIFVRELDRSSVLYWNRGAEKLYGWSRLEALGQTTHDLLQTRFPVPLDEIVRQVMETGHWEGELVHHSKDGREIAVASRWALQHDRAGNPTGILEINSDITEQVRARRELARYAENLERSNRELEQFAYVASHDLQEPLRIVGSYTQLLARRYSGRLDQDADKYIAYAVDGATRMQQLIQDLLSYSRVATRGEDLRPTDAEKALSAALRNLDLLIRENDAAIEHQPLPVVMADVGQMTQLFQNLIGNAIKFRSEDRPHIAIAAERQDTLYRFSIADNGIGIDPKYHERVFTIFQRLHTRERYAGTGIGLAICKRIVERFGGRIWFESASGCGTTFFFTIPAAEEGDDESGKTG